MGIFMENTEVSDVRTVAEIQDMLARRGARSVMVQYDAGRVAGVDFLLSINGRDIPFRLPCRWQSVQRLLEKSGRRLRKKDTWESWARRVAWRQILRWVESQMALIETGMVQQGEIFMPFAIVSQNGATRTMFEMASESYFKALPAPTAEQ